MAVKLTASYRKHLSCLMLLPLMWLASCNEERPSTEDARIQREVDQRVETIRTEMKVSEDRWHTARIISFCLLAGGSLIWLFNSGGFGSGRGAYAPVPDGKSPESQNRRRVIDRPYYDPDDEPDEYPHRR